MVNYPLLVWQNNYKLLEVINIMCKSLHCISMLCVCVCVFVCVCVRSRACMHVHEENLACLLHACFQVNSYVHRCNTCNYFEVVAMVLAGYALVLSQHPPTCE